MTARQGGDERALTAETHRFLLGRGHELLDLVSRIEGAAVSSEAARMRTELLWRKGAAAEGTLLAAMVDLVAGLTGLSPSDRKLRDDLLGALRVLADGAEALRQKARAVRPDSLSAPRQTA